MPRASPLDDVEHARDRGEPPGGGGGDVVAAGKRDLDCTPPVGKRREEAHLSALRPLSAAGRSSDFKSSSAAFE